MQSDAHFLAFCHQFGRSASTARRTGSGAASECVGHLTNVERPLLNPSLVDPPRDRTAREQRAIGEKKVPPMLRSVQPGPRLGAAAWQPGAVWSRPARPGSSAQSAPETVPMPLFSVCMSVMCARFLARKRHRVTVFVWWLCPGLAADGSELCHSNLRQSLAIRKRPHAVSRRIVLGLFHEITDYGPNPFPLADRRGAL